ncbi:hypothetical protein FJTKL_00264 [Diaporthe vaccinii]|uniref:Uncharacterized protein n=1 Tax=Diaporthe vaccinii TaxID=105482 RepID=A0ABR4E3Z3_9PEZI
MKFFSIGGLSLLLATVLGSPSPDGATAKGPRAIATKSTTRRCAGAGGAISGRNNVWDGFVDACGDAAGKTLEGKGEHYWERIIGPARKIDYYVRNLCDKPVTIDEDDCRRKFEGLINWCEWTYDTHKGGYWDHECLSWVYDTNSR